MDGRFWLFTLRGHSPADVYSVDVSTAKLERWTTSETGGLNPENFVEPQLVKWKSFDRREIRLAVLAKDEAGFGKVSGHHQHSRRA